MLWPWLVIVMGTLSMVWGIVLLVLDGEPYYRTPGFVMIGLGLVCFSILSKVGLLALVWRRTFAPRQPGAADPDRDRARAACSWPRSSSRPRSTDSNVFIAARVLVGLGAICFTLYSIVSILESGTSSSEG